MVHAAAVLYPTGREGRNHINSVPTASISLNMETWMSMSTSTHSSPYNRRGKQHFPPLFKSGGCPHVQQRKLVNMNPGFKRGNKGKGDFQEVSDI